MGRAARPGVEHQRDVLLGLGEERRDVALVGEGGRLPLDALTHTRVRREHDVADGENQLFLGVVVAVEPRIDVRAGLHHPVTLTLCRVLHKRRVGRPDASRPR